METCYMEKLEAENTMSAGLVDLLWRFNFFRAVEGLAWYSRFRNNNMQEGATIKVKFRV
jgi:hypothetical protein